MTYTAMHMQDYPGESPSARWCDVKCVVAGSLDLSFRLGESSIHIDGLTTVQARELIVRLEQELGDM